MIKDSFDSEKLSFSLEEPDSNRKSQREDNGKISTDLINAISTTLTMIIEENKNLKNYNSILQKQNRMIFSALSVPKISIYDYLIRIQKYSNIEKNTLILSLIFIDLLCTKSKLTLTYFNIHRILVGSILIAIKYNEDSVYNNKYYSEIAGVDIKELNSIEYKFIELCNFKMFISEKIFEHYSNYLESFKKINNNQ